MIPLVYLDFQQSQFWVAGSYYPLSALFPDGAAIRSDFYSLATPLMVGAWNEGFGAAGTMMVCECQAPTPLPPSPPAPPPFETLTYIINGFNNSVPDLNPNSGLQLLQGGPSAPFSSTLLIETPTQQTQFAAPAETFHQYAFLWGVPENPNPTFSLDGGAPTFSPQVGPGVANSVAIGVDYNTSSDPTFWTPTSGIINFFALYQALDNPQPFDLASASTLGARPGFPGAQTGTLTKPYMPSTPLMGGVMPCCVPGGLCHC